jgi:phosphoribosylformimino-5-aminoimidazole carboxamide ribotide isomerase
MSSRRSSIPKRAAKLASASTPTSHVSVSAPRHPLPSRSFPALFDVIPAIDLQDGRCVRLIQGDFAKATVFGEDPVRIARGWAEAGATRIHVVDLDAARTGQPMQLDIVREIARALSVPVQLGGGLRSLAALEAAFAAGVDRAILGTAALEDTNLLDVALEHYPEQIAVGVDARNGRVAVRGWLDLSDRSSLAFARALERRGVQTIIWTNIARDGMLNGPDAAGVAQMVAAVPRVDVIASGGVSKLSDVLDLIDTGARGAIVGKALYTGDLDLAEAVAAARARSAGPDLASAREFVGC